MASAAFKFEYVPPNSSNNLGLLFCLILLLLYVVWSVQEEGGGWHVPIWLMSLLTSLITFISERSSTIMGAVVPILIMAWRYELVTH